MIYRTLGKTGLRVSQLGFGAMRLPMLGEGETARVNRDLAIPMLHRAFDSGVNYVDTAVGYCNQDSQVAVGEALKGYRDKIIVSTKNPYYDEDETKWWGNLENSLKRLNVSHIDIYHHHGVNAKNFDEKVLPRLSKWMRKAQSQGLIKHIACSFHDNNTALKHILDADYAQVITLQYNMLDRQLEEGIAYAHAKGVGIVVMGPVAGGRLGVDSEVLNSMLPNVRRVPELAMRFVLSNPHVSVALSGMSTLQQVVENLATSADAVALSPADKQAIEEHLTRLKGMSDLYCTGCNYCKPCNRNVDIPGVLAKYNLGRVWGLWDMARQQYGGMVKKGIGADQCAQCSECESKCPQHLKICEELQKAHEALTKKA